jgi:hypothetical protein
MIMVKYKRPHADRFDLAWPETLVVDASGQFRGFKMPFFGDDWVDLEDLMQAKGAEKEFGVGARHRVMIGANLAMAVGALHDLKVHWIDLKPCNVRVNLKKMSVASLDCDGMSVVEIGGANGRRFYAASAVYYCRISWYRWSACSCSTGFFGKNFLVTRKQGAFSAFSGRNSLPYCIGRIPKPGFANRTGGS